jgi:hypothetical protein
MTVPRLRAPAAALACALLTACSSAVSGSAAPAAGTPPPAAAAPPASTAPAVPESERRDIEVLEQGFTAWPVEFLGNKVSYAVALRNPNPSTWVADRVLVTFTFRDATGAVVLIDDLGTVYTVLPGQTTAVVTNGLADDPATLPTSMEVAIVETDWVQAADVTPGAVTMGPAVTRPEPDGDRYPGLFVECDATSTYTSVLPSVAVHLVYRDAAGVIIGGSLNRVGADAGGLPGAATTSLELFDYFPPPPGVPAAECYSSFVTPR